MDQLPEKVYIIGLDNKIEHTKISGVVLPSFDHYNIYPITIDRERVFLTKEAAREALKKRLYEEAAKLKDLAETI